MDTKGNGGHFKLSIRITVVGMFLVITSLTAAVAIGLQYYFSSLLAGEAAVGSYRQAANSTSNYLASVDSRAEHAVDMLAAYPSLTHDGKVAPETQEIFAATLRRNPLFYAIYIGFSSGEFYELVNLNSSALVRPQLGALPQDRWVVIRIDSDAAERRRDIYYYDSDFKLRSRRSELTDYSPAKRPWYVNADEGLTYKTDPYLFQHLQAPGQTYSMRLAGGDAVLAVDITLASLSERMKQETLNDQSTTFLFRKDGQLIASSESAPPSLNLPAAKPLTLSKRQQRLVAENPVLRVSNESDWPPFDFTVAGEPYGYSIDVLSLVSQMTGLEFRYINGLSWPELKSMYLKGEIDLIHPMLGTEENRDLGRVSQPMITAQFGVLTRGDAAPVTEINQLNKKRVAIPSGWAMLETLHKHFPQIEVLEVDGVRGMFDAVRTGRADAAIDMAAILNYHARQYFLKDVAIHAPLDFGGVKVPQTLHYIVHPSKGELVELIDLALASLSKAQLRTLKLHWLLNGADSEQTATVPYEELVELARDKDAHQRLKEIMLDGQEHFVYVQPLIGGGKSTDFFAVVTPAAAVMEPVLWRVQVVIGVTAAILLLLLPLSSQLASYIVHPIRQLARENDKLRKRHYRKVEGVDSRIVEIDDLSTSLVAMAKSMERHAKEQEALMDAFIQIIAQAIDDKSPYTGAHCKRVPELAMLLAEKAQQSDQAPFDEFAFSNEAEWREFRIGAWLHDCGKITTPEFVVDKATKLETIHNRIHEVRMRFEVLWRDAVIDYWEHRYDQPDQEPRWRQELEQRQAQLRDDYAFIAASNVGGEFMDEADIERLERLAKVNWLRHFDDRLGLSQEELKRFAAVPTSPLPASEPLLADKPWHIIQRGQNNHYPAHLGINMDVPEHLYNRGELHNLRTSRGTLNPEERFKINEHMISTIRMLDRLPLPEELARVPRYASTHHETLDGRGYPRRLTGKELSIPERIMVLADIFEALTASDRPYKKAKSVSVALDILYSMVQENHVDRDVFELFLRSGAYLEYAERYLPESQRDEVDIAKYLDS